MTLNPLKKRILEICYKNKMGHISSALNAVDVLDEIYSIKKENEPVILSCGHCGIGLYVVLQSHYGIDAEYLYKKHGLHPHRDLDNKIDLSSGSLGSGAIIACGMALADRSKNVYCVISDGECDSGAVIEAFRFKRDNNLGNLKIYVLSNGMSAFRMVDTEFLKGLLTYIDKDIIIKDVGCQDIPLLNNIAGHYKILTESEYNSITNQ